MIPPDNQAALPSNKWLRVSKQPWLLGRRFAAPFLSGPAAVRHLNSKLRSDPIGSDPFRFHRFSRFGLVLSDPTPELRTACMFWTVERGEGEGRSRARRTSRAVQERGDIASKQQGYPFRTDYNKLATLIETNGKLSALFACNAIPIKVGERFCNLRLVTLFD